MTPAEAARVLAVAVTLDARLTPRTTEDARARAMMWSVTLTDGMPPEWAERAVRDHYAANTASLLPAYLNTLWARYVADRAVKRQAEDARRARYEAEKRAVPMPAYVRKAALTPSCGQPVDEEETP